MKTIHFIGLVRLLKETLLALVAIKSTYLQLLIYVLQPKKTAFTGTCKLEFPVKDMNKYSTLASYESILIHLNTFYLWYFVSG